MYFPSIALSALREFRHKIRSKGIKMLNRLHNFSFFLSTTDSTEICKMCEWKWHFSYFCPIRMIDYFGQFRKQEKKFFTHKPKKLTKEKKNTHKPKYFNF